MRAYEFTESSTLLDQLLAAESGNWTMLEASGMAQFNKSDMFDDTVKNRMQMLPAIQEKIKEFMDTKSRDPMQPYGGKDKPFGGNGPIGQAFPKMRYAHLNYDLSLFYSMEGRNPTVFKLYGVFSHDDIGIGQPMNIKRQKNFISKLKREF